MSVEENSDIAEAIVESANRLFDEVERRRGGRSDPLPDWAMVRVLYLGRALDRHRERLRARSNPSPLRTVRGEIVSLDDPGKRFGGDVIMASLCPGRRLVVLGEKGCTTSVIKWVRPEGEGTTLIGTRHSRYRLTTEAAHEPSDSVQPRWPKNLAPWLCRQIVMGAIWVILGRRGVLVP